MTIVFPKIPKGSPKVAVYKITFDNKWFYIGGTSNFRNRFGGWHGRFKSGKIGNDNIASVLHPEMVIRFEIIEWVKSSLEIDAAEDFHIQYHWGNPLLLNHQPTAFKSLIGKV